MRTLRKVADGLIGLSASISALALILVMGVIVVDVIGRGFGSPLYGSHDITTMVMVVIVFGAMALCDRDGGHIAVDLFERRFPPAMNRVIDILVAAGGAVIFVARQGHQGFRQHICQHQSGIAAITRSGVIG